jgi:hypothetical protein
MYGVHECSEPLISPFCLRAMLVVLTYVVFFIINTLRVISSASLTKLREPVGFVPSFPAYFIPTEFRKQETLGC